MEIREATIEDSLELSRLRKSTIRNVNKHDYSPEQIRDWSKSGNTKDFRKKHSERIRYVAIEDGKIIGFADIRKDTPNEMGSLYVHKDFLRQGVGTRLMETIEDVVKNLGVKRFELLASITAKPFYENMGYTVISEVKNEKRGDEFLMDKELFG